MALKSTGINVAENVEHLLRNGSADHRRKVTRFLTWAQRASILYGDEKMRSKREVRDSCWFGKWAAHVIALPHRILGRRASS